MKKCLLRSLMAFGVCLFLSLPVCRADDDWQYWNLFQIKAKVTDEISWRVFSEQWLVDDFSHFYLTNVDTGLTWKSNKYWSLGAFYRHQYVAPVNASSISENRYYPEITFYAPFEHIKFSDRTRFEYHDTRKKDFWIFRNRLTATVPFKIKDLPVDPYIYNELFYHTQIGGIQENRAGVGLSFGLGKHVNLNIFYQVRHTRKRADWQSAQVLGTMWTLSL